MFLRYLAFVIALATGVFTSQLPEFAQQAGVNEKVIREIADHHALI